MYKLIFIIISILGLFHCSPLKEKKMESFFVHNENFINTLESIDLKEVEPGLFQDKQGKIYIMAFGGQRYVVHPTLNDYLEIKGKIIYFSIDSISSSFILLEEEDVKKVLKRANLQRVVKKFNSIETAYCLDNNEILMMDSDKTYGFLFKNKQEMDIILS